MKKTFLKLTAGLLAVVMVFALVGCNNKGDVSDGGNTSSGGKKVLRFLSNVQDREHTEGLVEQMQLDKWLEQNPDFQFDYEFVPNANIQEKEAQYTATDNLPDVYKEWGGTVDFDQRVKRQMIVPIWDSPEQANEEGYDYPDGALTKWQISDGSDTGVYAGVVNFDFYIWYYNGEIFQKEGWTEPTTWAELIQLLDDISAKGYVPMSMSGKDAYQHAMLIEDIAQKVSGDKDIAANLIEGKKKFTQDADIRRTFELAKELVDHNLGGGTSWLAQDYAGARGLFVNGEIPLYYFGSWEFMMISDDQLTDSFKENVDFFLTPVPEGGKGNIGMLEGFYGCGFSVASKSAYKDDAVGLIKFYFQKENFAKDAWEMKVFVPAQNFSEFASDNDAKLQKKILEVMDSKTSTLLAGQMYQYSNNWMGVTSPLWLDFFAGTLSVDDILPELEQYAEQTMQDVEMSDAA